MLISMLVPVFAQETPTSDDSEIYASFQPEFLEYTEEELSLLSSDEIDNLFEKTFSASANDFSDEVVYLAIQNLGKMYKNYYTQNYTSSQANASSTNKPLQEYTGDIGVSWQRDLDKSPFTLNETINVWYVTDAVYLTEIQAMTIAAGMQPSVVDVMIAYVLGEVGGEIATEALREALELSEKELPWLPAAVVSMGIGIWTFMSEMDSRTMMSYVEKMDDDDLLQICFRMTGTNVIKEYEVVDVDAELFKTDAHGHKTYTYFDIPNPYMNCYGVWTLDDVSNFL